MKKLISIIIISLSFLPLMAQNDDYIKQAQSYQREAEYYTRQALGFDREVDYYNRQAQGHLSPSLTFNYPFFLLSSTLRFSFAVLCTTNFSRF